MFLLVSPNLLFEQYCFIVSLSPKVRLNPKGSFIYGKVRKRGNKKKKKNYVQATEYYSSF